MNSFGMIMGGAGFLSLLAMVGVIALTIVLYIKFLGKKADPNAKGTKFFRFDHFYIEKILHFIYLLNVVAITVVAVLTPFAAASTAGMMYGSTFFDVVGAFFGGIVTGLILFAVSQFICRVVFEYLLIFVRMSNDARDIRNVVTGFSAPAAPATPAPAGPSPFSGIASVIADKASQVKASAANAVSQVSNPAPAAPAPTPMPVAPSPASAATAPVAPAPVAPAPAPAAPAPVAPAAPVPAASETWACACGSTGNTGKFCGSCGAPRP